jgi:hypothetical protein
MTAITNGICSLPDSQVPPFFQYNFYLQTIRSNNLASGWTELEYKSSALFVDARSQLKDNLRFILRDTGPAAPFAFADEGGVGTYGSGETYSFPLNHAFASCYSSGGMDYSYFNVTFDPLRPVFDNCCYRNFIFDQSELETNGLLDTSVNYDGFGDEFIGYNYGSLLCITNTLTYFFDLASYLASTNPTVPVSQITTNESTWILPTENGQNASAGELNFYGLPYISDKDAYLTNGEIEVATIFPGDPLLDGDQQEYFQIAQPVFEPAGYYFTQYIEDILPNMPEQNGFSPTNTTQTMIAGLGSPLTVAGYAKFIVSNTPCYLGQYFDKAYETDTNGNVTTATTGILSPYGNLFPTAPGQMALVTMPDVDTGERGTCTVDVVSLQLDANHDGTMDLSFNSTDATSQSNPMRIWINDGNDGTGIGQDIDIEGNTNLANYAYGQIRSERNLENFFRLWICGPPLLPPSQGYSATLSMTPVSGSPAINLYPAYSPDGGTEYLNNTNVAAAQISTAYVLETPVIAYGTALTNINGNQSYKLPVDSYGNVVFTHFLFEGAGVGSGQLTLTISENSNIVAQTSVWLDIHQVEDFYERAVITNDLSGSISNWTSGIESVAPAIITDPGAATNIIVYVHGGDDDDTSWLDRSDALVKRLYWADYYGKVATVQWPSPLQSEILTHYSIEWFNTSEVIAYKSASAFKNYLNQLKARFPNYQLDLLPHSLGVAVVAESLREGAPCDTVIFADCAMSASAFDLDAPTNEALLSFENGTGTPWLQPMGYYGIYTNLTGRMVNYYNTNDDLLDKWTSDQKYTKPPSGFYLYDGTNSWNEFNDIDYLVTDPQESRAMVSRSRSLAIGNIGPTAGQTGQGVIQSAIDVGTQFNIGSSEEEHSAFYTRPIQTILPLYVQFLDSLRP